MSEMNNSRDLCDDSSSDDECDSQLTNGFMGTPSTSFQMPSAKKKSEKRKVEEEPPDYMEPKYMKMMEKMGHEKGKGLGKKQQGITEPIKASDQMSKRGLGYKIKGLEVDRELEWDSRDEFVQVEEAVNWLHSKEDPTLNEEELSDWVEFGNRSERIDNETYFCQPNIVQEVVSNKTIFDSLNPNEMRQARSKANPFESIRSLFFLNRAAAKMANMDAVFDYIFTNPVNENGISLVQPDEPFYFADICAAPGGFSEYVLWRNKEFNKGIPNVKGFGFTLKENDFKLSDFFAAAPEFFEPHYGELGDGDIFQSVNISAFKHFVLESTNKRGVHLLMADGGFSVSGQECIQEILSKQLYLCQLLTALAVLREDGNLVCKLFDLFTPFSISLVYLMYLCFKQISIHKPNTSRPANSERYLICKWKKSGTKSIENYMFEVNENLMNCKGVTDIISIVPFEIIQENKEFFKYVYSSNTELGARQIVALKKVQAFCKNDSLRETRQFSLKNECIQYWNVPIKTRTVPFKGEARDRVKTLLQNNIGVLGSVTASLDKTYINFIKSRHDYDFVVLSSAVNHYKSDRGFFYGGGGKNVFFYNTNEEKWKNLDIRIELPRDTIVFAEIATELTLRDRLPPKKTSALHLIDGIILNGFDISKHSLNQRNKILRKFASTINRPTITCITPVRCKQLHPFRDLESVIFSDRLRNFDKKQIYRENYLPNFDECLISPTCILLLKNTHRYWTTSFSKREKVLYYFNTKTNTAMYTQEAKVYEVVASTQDALTKGFYWWWNDTNPNHTDPVKLQLPDIVKYLQSLPM